MQPHERIIFDLGNCTMDQALRFTDEFNGHVGLFRVNSQMILRGMKDIFLAKGEAGLGKYLYNMGQLCRSMSGNVFLDIQLNGSCEEIETAHALN